MALRGRGGARKTPRNAVLLQGTQAARPHADRRDGDLVQPMPRRRGHPLTTLLSVIIATVVLNTPVTKEMVVGGILTMMVLAQRAGLPPRLAALMGGVACFGLRMAGAVGHWGLPRYQ